MEKKKIYFSVPFEITQGVKVRDGEIRKYFEWDIFERFFRFIISLFPRVREKEVGAVYSTLRKGCLYVL